VQAASQAVINTMQEDIFFQLNVIFIFPCGNSSCSLRSGQALGSAAETALSPSLGMTKMN
jgi:hypothetical protein